MMGIFDLRDELRQPRHPDPEHRYTPFKQSMILALKLTEKQEEALLAARRKFLVECQVFRKQRESSAGEIKKASFFDFFGLKRAL